MPFRRTVGSHIPKDGNHTTVRSKLYYMPVSGQAPGSFLQRRPGGSLIIRKHHQRIAYPVIFTRYTDKPFAIGLCMPVSDVICNVVTILPVMLHLRFLSRVRSREERAN